MCRILDDSPLIFIFKPNLNHRLQPPNCHISSILCYIYIYIGIHNVQTSLYIYINRTAINVQTFHSKSAPHISKMPPLPIGTMFLSKHTLSIYTNIHTLPYRRGRVVIAIVFSNARGYTLYIDVCLPPCIRCAHTGSKQYTRVYTRKVVGIRERNASPHPNP